MTYFILHECSLFILKSVVIPILLWILPDQYEQFNAEHLYDHKAVMPFYALLRSILIEFVYVSPEVLPFIEFISNYILTLLLNFNIL